MSADLDFLADFGFKVLTDNFGFISQVKIKLG